MNSERWQKIKGLFDAAVELAPAKRGKFLKKTCGTDVELRREVEKLLASFEMAESFMESPAAAEVASLIVGKNQKLNSGQRVAHYEIVLQIGEGGMGEVYLAQDTRLNRRVALKILPANLTIDKSRLGRFKQEAQAASALNHPNIITIYEIREYKKTHLIATEFVEGETIRQKMSGVNLKTSEILDVIVQVASALSVAHRAGVIHRDIKPENIMIRPDGIVKLLDFGLAKLQDREIRRREEGEIGGQGDRENQSHLSTISPSPLLPFSPSQSLTAPGMVMGTVNYMSPEQAQGKAVDRRTDLWSLGVCLYEMLTGKTPFTGKTINHTLVAIMENQPLIIKSVPAELGRITAKLLEKNPENRYLTANDLLFDLRRLQKLIKSESNQTEDPDFTTAKTELLPESASVWEVASVAPVPNNLSGQLLPLVGREKEIAEIENLLKREDVRLLTLTGIGGTGKTRLALEIAQKMLSLFADGVFFIPLAAVRNAEFVASEIAQPLGVKDAGGKSLLDALKDFLREKQILLVVDNFEQILSAAPVLNELLAAAPRVQMLVTSRALLHLRVEREFIVPPLDVPSDIAELSADDLLQCESVKLFTERAQAVKSNLAATKENLQIIAEICSRLDGLPLAIELAAARVKILSPSAILSRLESSFKLLTGGARDLPAHQKTMRGAIEWSYDLLEEDEKILFRRLSVFAGGFTIEAAETVGSWQEAEGSQEQLADASVEQKSLSNDNELLPTANRLLPTDFDVLDGITSLVDKSLLVQKEQTDGESRFRLLEVVREYASEVLQTSRESEMIRKNHAAFFLALAKEAEPELFGKQGTKWLNRLEEEHDNLRAALAWSAVSDAETSTNLTAAMRRFWILHNHLTEGRKWLEAALERSGDTPPDIYFKLLNALGFTAGYQGDCETARKAHEKGLEAGRAANDWRQIALSNRGLGAIAKKEGDIATARKFIGEALKINRRLDDTFGIAVSLNNLGDLARMEGDFRTARPLLEESLAISRQIGNKEGVCGSLNNLAATAYGEGDFTAAHSHYAEALAIAQELGDKITVSYSLDGFAALAAGRGNAETAAQLAGAAERMRESLGFDTEPAEQRFRDAYLAELQSVLDKERFADFYKQGRAFSLKKAVALAPQESTAESFEDTTQRVGLNAQTTDKSPPAEIKSALIQPTTADGERAHSTSSAEYIVTEIKNHKRGFFWILAALLIGLIGFSAYYFYSASRQPKFSSIAVLPLNNASGDANLDYLSDGLSENLINKLSQIGQLKVIAQSSAFRFKGKEFDPKEAGKTLGVEALLTGRITKFGDGLSIGIELIDARDGSLIWNEKYNLNSFDAAFDAELVQGRIALQIAAKLDLDLTGTQNEQLKKRSTQNPQAYQLFLNAALVKRKSNTVEANRKAIDYYNQAIALDPNFAPAYASLANSYRFLQLSSNVGNKKELEEKMRQAIAKAQELDDTLPEIYTTLGGIELNEFDLPGAEKAYKRAVELNPNSAGAHSGYANYLTNVGKFDEALTHNRLAQQLDPLSLGLKITEGRTLFVARRYDEAIRLLQTLAKTAPNNPAIHYYLAISYTFKGMFVEAIAAHEKSTEISGEQAGEFYIYTLAKAGKTEQARQYLERAKKRENYSPAEFAVAYIALGDKEQAFAALEKAFEERDPQLQYLKIDPHYDEIRSDPRFQDLLRRVGLPQ